MSGSDAASKGVLAEVKGLLPKLLTEFIGTFYLTFCVGMSAKSNAAAPLCIGGVLVAMVYAGGHVSGAHYNPTVTAAVFTRARFRSTALGLTWLAASLYVVAQLVGAFVGGAFALALVGEDGLGYPAYPEGMHGAIGVEMLWSFLLATVVLNVATSNAQDNNNYYGLAIGFTVFSGAVVVGGLSGGAFNAAVGLALPLLAGSPVQVWVYLVFPTIAGVLAGLFFRFSSPDDFGVVRKGVLLGELPAYAMEFVTTFFLSTYVALSPLFGASKLAEVAMFALTVALLSMAGATSGCHMNPAVSVGVYLRSVKSPIAGGFPARKLAAYVLSQLLGGATAALVAAGLLRELRVGGTVVTDSVIGFPFPVASTGKAFLAEVIGTTALVYVVLNVATVRHLARNSFFGIAIGITIAAVGGAIGPVSGGCLNPAVGLLGAFGSTWQPAGIDMSPIWIYFVAPPLGGVLAALLFRFQNHAAEYSAKAYEPVDGIGRHYQAMTEGNEEAQRFMLHDSARTVTAVKTSLNTAVFIAKLKAKKEGHASSTATQAKVHPSTSASTD